VSSIFDLLEEDFGIVPEAEDLINRVSVYNLHRDIAESIERLTPPDKLLVLSVALTEKSVKGTQPYKSIENLKIWRNSYAHGKCTDRPSKTLRHNHLIEPEEYPSVPKKNQEMCKYIEDYLELARYLRSISKNEYTKGILVHDSEIENYVKEIRRYKFTYDGEGQLYEINYE